MPCWRKWLGLVLLGWTTMAAAEGPADLPAEIPVPPLHARVTDLTHTLSAEQRAALDGRLADLEKRKGAQIAVLIVPTTRPETIEQYARRVLDEWKLGRKGVDDGALLLVAKDDRALRIETQYGLEGVIPDAIAKRIIEEQIVPRFKQGDFAGGIEAGVARLVGLVDGEPLPAPKPARSDNPASFGDILPLLAFGVFFLGGLLRMMFGQFLGASVGAIVVAALVWLLASSILAAAAAGVFAFVFLLAGATLQFLVLDWAKAAMGLNVEDAAILQAISALGIAIGSVVAAFLVPIHKSLRVLPVGVGMGILVCAMIGIHEPTVAKILLVLIGAAAGFFVVPMNALLQHRGHILVGAGHSIAVQNFNENAGILIMVATYYLLLRMDVSVNGAILIFGLFVSATMLLVMNWHRCNVGRHGEEINRLLDVARTSSHH